MKFKTKPYDHQLEEWQRSRSAHVRAILWEQGCVDAETEYLSPAGWKRMDSYSEGMVAQWHPNTGVAEFVTPEEYVSKPCNKMIRITGQRGTDQALSLEHKIPFLTKRGDRVAGCMSAKQLVSHLENKQSIKLPSNFQLQLQGKGINLTDNQLRLSVAVFADGHFPSNCKTPRCTIRLKKVGEIARLRFLLSSVRIVCYERKCKSSGFTVFSFEAPSGRMKKFPASWWTSTNQCQRNILLDEIPRWDGSKRHGKGWSYFSKNESDADFVQFLVCGASGVCYKTPDSREGRNTVWGVHVRGTRLSGFSIRSSNIMNHDPLNGKKYCFSVPSGFLIFRRNGRVFPSGNTGKTKLALDTGAWLRCTGEIDAMLVVAPNGVHENWITDEVPAHLPDELDGHGFSYVTQRAGTQWHRRALEQTITHPGFPVLAMSYDALVTGHGRRAAEEFLHKRRVLYILDESQRIKTAKTKRSKAAIVTGRRTPYKRILSGTPVTNTPFDLYPQYRFLDEGYWTDRGFASKEAFETYFAIWETRVKTASGFKKLEDCEEGEVYYDAKRKRATDPRTGQRLERFSRVAEYRNYEQLQEMIAGMSSRVLKEDVLDLPDKVYTKRYFDLDPDAKRAYVQMRDEFLAILDTGEMVMAPLVITQLLRLQQIACGYLPSNDPEGTYAQVGSNPRMRLLLDTLADVEGQAIIYARFKQDIAQICKELGEHAVRYDGSVGRADRLRARQRFQAGRVRFFVANPAAAGVGLTLHAAKTVIYYSNSFNLEHRLQSEDRAHRIGQDGQIIGFDEEGDPIMGVRYIDLIARNTVDRKLVEVLRSKLNMASMCIGDAARDWL